MIHEELCDVMLLFLGCFCGTIEEDGQVKYVVAAGGPGQVSAFIYNLDEGTWRRGMVNFCTRSSHTSQLPIYSYR